MASESDPTAIRVIAVTVEDVVTALELNRTTGRHAVLRATPPFSGRMRARLHNVQAPNKDESAISTNRTVEESGQPDSSATPLHIEPETLLAPECPSYPRPAETEDKLRNDPDETYTVECHHERHQEAVADWRETIAGEIDSQTTLQTPDGAHDVEVVALGELSAQLSETA